MNTIFDPTKFTNEATPTEYFRRNAWGGGHTPETDPSRKGWQKRPSKKAPKVLVIGQPGKPGCASVMEMSTTLDVALYVETAKEISAVLEEGKSLGCFDPYYRQIKPISGWGLEVIRWIEEMRRTHDL